MIVELGHSMLLTSLIIAAIGSLAPLYIMRKSTSLSLRFSQINGAFLLALLLGAIGSLIYGFITSDFSLKLVTLNSEVSEPLLYRLVALWGNHDGSLLLWVLTLSIYITCFSFSGRGIATNKDRTRMLTLLSAILFGFILFLITTSNPFETLSITPHKGLGLNPILQDPSMIFHPPSLYFGYIGFVIPFAIAVGFLWRGHFKKEHAAWLRIWTLIPWCFLTLGITTGSLWAYYELGWGGWWSWDPVENASLFPWLISTALLHAIGAYRRSGSLKLWCLFLALTSYISSMLGTYITRSGIVSSIHGFAQNEQRGLYLLIFTGILAFLSLLLFLARAYKMRSPQKPSYSTKSGFIALNIYGFLCALIILMIGTFYPIWGDATVAKSFFNTTINPIALGILFLMGMTTFTRWSLKKGNSEKIWPKFKKNLLFFNIGLLVISILLYREIPEKNIENLIAIFALGLSLWVVLTSIKTWVQKRSHAMMLAHIGFAICIIGMSTDALFKQEGNLWLTHGEGKSFSEYTFILDHIEQNNHVTYNSEVAHITLLNSKGKSVAKLKPETRLYKTKQTLLSKTAITQHYCSHIYVVLGPMLTNGQRSIRVFYHPLIILIWLGGFLMSLAGGIGFISAVVTPKIHKRRYIARHIVD